MCRPARKGILFWVSGLAEGILCGNFCQGKVKCWQSELAMQFAAKELPTLRCYMGNLPIFTNILVAYPTIEFVFLPHFPSQILLQRFQEIDFLIDTVGR